MRRLVIFIIIAIALSLTLVFSVTGVEYAKTHRDYTLAVPIFVDSFFVSDTVYYQFPLYDTVIDTNMYNEIDTVLKMIYPWPSVYDQHSYEVWIDTSAGTPITYDRWAMEDWALAFYIVELNAGADVDSVSGHLQYTHTPSLAWTVPYTLFTDIDASAYLLTYYPLDLYDNWKLYRYARLRLIVTSDSVAVSGWLVGRQIKIHELVEPGE